VFGTGEFHRIHAHVNFGDAGVGGGGPLGLPVQAARR
jgi:hypothetical protein